jgi:hypothetical protein
MAIVDVGALRLAETMNLVATGLDVNITVAVTESFKLIRMTPNAGPCVLLLPYVIKTTRWR